MLDQFHQFLAKNGHTREKSLLYDVKWVSECYTHLNERIEHKIGSEQRQQFLTHLSTNHEDWQVRQADHSLRLPVVMTPQEVERIFARMLGVHRLMAMLTYGCGLRVTECASLRIKDVDLGQGILIVRAAKGDKDRKGRSRNFSVTGIFRPP